MRILIMFLFSFVLINKTNECFDLSIGNINCKELSIYYELNDKQEIVSQVDYRKETVTDKLNNKELSSHIEVIKYPTEGLIEKEIKINKYGVQYFYKYKQNGKEKLELVESANYRSNNWDIKNILHK